MLGCFKTKRIEMVTLLFMLAVFPVVYSCDPATQYENHGECCNKCGPGTRMSSDHSGCFDPHCMPCQEDEYQEAFTEKIICEVQPYCDQNKNFEGSTNRSKTSLSQCICKAGHHCSSKECLTCVPHTKCGPGQEILSTGDHIRDTVCQACPANTFSSDSSAESKCKQWTVCDKGSKAEANGTSTSDIVCVSVPTFSGRIAGYSFVVAALVTGVVGIILWKYKGKHGESYKKGKEPCVECLGCERRPTEDRNNEGRNSEGPEEEREQLKPLIQNGKPLSPPSPISQPLPGTQTPVENDVNDSQAESSAKAEEMTENGHVVAQEQGKQHDTSQMVSHNHSASPSAEHNIQLSGCALP
ncbi:tumor necrosis factor receptor superfamily member 5 [Salmo trutta]|uniref:CD40 molecule, TNF receptor superfamily member 5 n=1 Tax=Salmo trutta TaxID=8032 RepID=A0A674BQ78_SALTR|nr:tumor necrosis factor receptor superfamily member 5-like [Salmo trutta]